jgi:hypothetical protein
MRKFCIVTALLAALALPAFAQTAPLNVTPASVTTKVPAATPEVFPSATAPASTAAPAPAPPQTTPRKAPTRGVTKPLIVQNATADSVSLSCTDSDSAGVTGYFFYRGTVSGGESSTALNTTPTVPCAYIDLTVLGATTYFYNARSYCPTCTPTLSTSASNEAEAIVPANGAPDPPTGLTVGTIVGTNVPLKWTAPPVQVGYNAIATEILRGSTPTLPGPGIVGIVPASATSFTDPDCPRTCYYEIKSYDIQSDAKFVLSPPSNIVKATAN